MMMQRQNDEVVDLSLQDIYGNSINRSTANCYVVREPGQYKFPLVYGNAIKNGQVNTAAFTNNGGANSHDFVRVGGITITSPYINSFYELQDEPLLTNTDEDGVITNVQFVEGSDCGYVQFDVVDVPINGANCIISYRAAASVYSWHWHIWLWPHDLSPVEITNATGVKYNIMPVNLASKYDSDGVHIKNWFYQFGRPTPLLCPASYNSTDDHSPGEFGAVDKASSLAEGLFGHPYYFFCFNSSPYNWFGDKSYYNLWDAACTGTGASDNDTVKTVYDPCPVGWKVPNGNTFTGLSILSSANGIVKMRRYSGDTTGVGFPLAGERNPYSGVVFSTGSSGSLRVTSSSSNNYAYITSISQDSVDTVVWTARTVGLSIRPVQDDITKIDEL